MPSMRHAKRVSAVLRFSMIPAWGRRAPGVSVAAEAPWQLNVEGVEVDVADMLEQLGGPGVGQGLGQLVAPRLVFGLEGSELVDGVGPPLRPRPAVLRPLEGPDGLASGAALALGVRHAHGSTRDAAAWMLAASAPPGSTVGADKGYDTARFVDEVRALEVTPHIAQKIRYSALDGRTTRHPGYQVSQRKRKLV